MAEYCQVEEVQQQYDGLCQYAQKITSCFGVNGKNDEMLGSPLFI